MIRVTNPKSSIDFYQQVSLSPFPCRHTLGLLNGALSVVEFPVFATQVLGMELFDTMEFDNFTLYFLGYNSEGLTDAEKASMKFNREGAFFVFHLEHF
jgi:catechol 2,3-dioxygenase-like lactoylglutathione lyase family enzyme